MNNKPPARHYINLGSTPCNEDCAQVGSPSYEKRAKAECRRYIEAIRAVMGPEPQGAELALKSFAHDFGTYWEVVCWYDPQNRGAMTYAFRCESEGPAEWPADVVK